MTSRLKGGGVKGGFLKIYGSASTKPYKFRDKRGEGVKKFELSVTSFKDEVIIGEQILLDFCKLNK